MSTYTLSPITEVSFQAFTAAFNLAYSDYFIPIVMTEGAFRALIARDDLDLARSVVALDGGTIVGTGLLGVRQHSGWIGEMGVIPRYRRRGIGRLMMRYLVDQAQALRIERLSLEVIEANTGAQALYRQMGFVPARWLYLLERDIHPPPAPDNTTWRIQPADPQELLDHYAAFHDHASCWQHDCPSLRGLIGHAQGYAAGERALLGYAIGWFDAQEIRFIDLATTPGDPQQRQSIACALLTYLHQTYPQAIGRVFNVPQDDPLLPAYYALGYSTRLRQIEMRLTLPAR